MPDDSVEMLLMQCLKINIKKSDEFLFMRLHFLNTFDGAIRGKLLKSKNVIKFKFKSLTKLKSDKRIY